MGFFVSKPEFFTGLTDTQVRAGDTVILQCEANTEEISVTWGKDGQELHCVPGKHIMNQNGKSLTLIIRNTDDKDDGLYTITLTNRKGSANSSANLTVEPDCWRKVEWKQDEMVNDMKNFNISNDKVKQLNFLLCGPVGAGKSSIINTIDSIFNKHISVDYHGGLESSVSQTLKFHTRKVGTAKDGFLPLVLNDTMGLEIHQSNGVHTNDIISAFKGHMKDGYKFNPKTPIDENSPYYRENPSLSDRMHCLVYVIPADKISLMGNEFFDKMKRVRDAVYERDSDFPQVILMTRVDMVCPVTNKDLSNIYRSKKIKDKMEECSTAMGVKMSCIFPLKNYHEETDIMEDVNCLMLHALTHIVRWADNYVDKLV